MTYPNQRTVAIAHSLAQGRAATSQTFTVRSALAVTNRVPSEGQSGPDVPFGLTERTGFGGVPAVEHIVRGDGGGVQRGCGRRVALYLYAIDGGQAAGA